MASIPYTVENESVRCTRIEQRKILGDYYRDLANRYDDYEQLAKKIGPTLAWPFKPQIPDFENA